MTTENKEMDGGAEGNSKLSRTNLKKQGSDVQSTETHEEIEPDKDDISNVSSGSEAVLTPIPLSAPIPEGAQTIENSLLDVGALNAALSQISDMELRLKNQMTWSEVHSANHTEVLKLLGDMSIRLWGMEMALKDRAGHSLPVQDQINIARLEERDVLDGLRSSKASRRPVLDLKKGHGMSLEKQWTKLKELTPNVFDDFKSAYELGESLYKSDPEARCSSGSHAEAKKFGQFLKPYLDGRILDVGCGPQKRASYLEGVDAKNLYGIDPIAPYKPHDFNFKRALGEFLPWEDNAFDTIISATTLDHYCNLELGLDEVARSLKVGGHFVCWIMLMDGAEAYDHREAKNANADAEHLYHVDLKWLEPMLGARGFELFEIMRFSTPFNYAFFSYRLKHKK